MKRNTRGFEVFDRLASRYDDWFDSTKGRFIFECEKECLRNFVRNEDNLWLEVGVGTGRFADALNISYGVDPSKAVLRIAKSRGIETCCGYGEQLPFRGASFGGILMVVAICFLDFPSKTFKECFRVLETGGMLIVGLVPSGSRWGRLYAEKGDMGHPFYSAAKFYSVRDILSLAAENGFSFVKAKSTLFNPPDLPLILPCEIKEGMDEQAGFVVMEFQKRTQ